MYNLALCFFDNEYNICSMYTDVVVAHDIAIIGVTFDHNFEVFGIVFGIHQSVFHGTMASHIFYVHQRWIVVFM